MISRIKQQHRVENIFSMYGVDVAANPSSRYVTVKCPFHDDNNPSMYIDRELQIWKCFACGAHGDVINAYARFQGLTNSEAIARLSQGVK